MRMQGRGAGMARDGWHTVAAGAGPAMHTVCVAVLALRMIPKARAAAR